MSTPDSSKRRIEQEIVKTQKMALYMPLFTSNFVRRRFFSDASSGAACFLNRAHASLLLTGKEDNRVTAHPLRTQHSLQQVTHNEVYRQSPFEACVSLFSAKRQGMQVEIELRELRQRHGRLEARVGYRETKFEE